MSREQVVIHYLLAIATFTKWLEDSVITECEFREITTVFADRYGLPENSIYR